MKDPTKRWFELRRIPPTRLSIPQLTEQFDLAQALTYMLDRSLYDAIMKHRAKCLAILRQAGEARGGTKYNIMRPGRPRHPHWTEIELTPDITFTHSEELVGKIIPTKEAQILKRMIKLQAKLLSQLKETP